MVKAGISAIDMREITEPSHQIVEVWKEAEVGALRYPRRNKFTGAMICWVHEK